MKKDNGAPLFIMLYPSVPSQSMKGNIENDMSNTSKTPIKMSALMEIRESLLYLSFRHRDHCVKYTEFSEIITSSSVSVVENHKMSLCIDLE